MTITCDPAATSNDVAYVWNLTVNETGQLSVYADLYESDGTTPADLSAFTDYQMQVRPSQDSQTVLLQLSVGSGITVMGNRISLAAALDSTVPRGCHYYDLAGIKTATERTFLLKGNFRVNPTVTRTT